MKRSVGSWRGTRAIAAASIIAAALLASCTARDIQAPAPPGMVLVNYMRSKTLYLPAYREFPDLDSIRRIRVGDDPAYTAKSIQVEFAVVMTGTAPEVALTRVRRFAVTCNHPRVGYAFHTLNGGGTLRPDGTYEATTRQAAFELPGLVDDFASVELGSRSTGRLALTRLAIKVCEAVGIATPLTRRAEQFPRGR